MGKRCVSSVDRVVKISKAQTPDLPEQQSYREIKRRSIVAGLRMMRAPAAALMDLAAVTNFVFHYVPLNEPS